MGFPMKITMILDYIRITYLFFFYIRKQNLKINEIKRWKKAFIHFSYNMRKTASDYAKHWRVIEGFVKSDIKLIKKAQGGVKGQAPILISVIFNEIDRIAVFLEHYRNIGIKKFAIIDNGSTDGTVEYLKRQPDVELFQTMDKFESRIKTGWINRIISFYGVKYWYLVVDADELLVWQNVEESRICDVIRILKKRKITRARALMIDMYPREKRWDTDESFQEVFIKCRYFDYNTYFHRKNEEVYFLGGGPRKRKLGMDIWLTKYPLFCLKDEEIMASPHAVYPFENEKKPCYLALLHYKFLTKNDKKRVHENARNGNYSRGSYEYKMYVRKQALNADYFDFYFEQSTEYQSSQSLAKIKEIDKIPL